MTPLAREIMKDSMRGQSKRVFPSFIHAAVERATFFDVTAVFDAAAELAVDLLNKKKEIPDDLCFIPSDSTWIEIAGELGRVGFLIQKYGPDCDAEVKQIWDDGRIEVAGYIRASDNTDSAWVSPAYPSCRRLRLMDEGGFWEGFPPEDINKVALYSVRVWLAMINSPRVIGRRTHMPSASFQRKLSARKGVAGKFPLQAWTELVLEVTPPRDESDKATHDTVLTGERALHFVRAHLRIVRGKLVKVTAHWRGNAANGIKRTRYSIVPPKNGVWPSFSEAQP